MGAHTRTLRAAFTDAGNAGCDVIFAGHLHSRESITLAVNAAEMGALVLGTLRALQRVRGEAGDAVR